MAVIVIAASVVGVPLSVYIPPTGGENVRPVPVRPAAVKVVALPVNENVALIMASPGQTTCCGPGPDVCIIWGAGLTIISAVVEVATHPGDTVFLTSTR